MACEPFQLAAKAVLVQPLDGLDDWSNRLGERTADARYQAALRSAMDELPPNYRTALILHDAEGTSTRDIAAVLDIDAAAVKAHVHRARLFLRTRLSGYSPVAMRRNRG
jgi:RNA polymerase sigma-70 factor (ECF subfamily)